MEKITKEEVEKVIKKIDEGLTFTEWTEDREPISEYYKKGDVYKKGTFLHQAIAPPIVFKSVEELRADLKGISLCKELKEELKKF